MKNDLAVMHAFDIVRESVITYHLHQLSKFLRFTFFSVIKQNQRTRFNDQCINVTSIKHRSHIAKQHMQANKQMDKADGIIILLYTY